VAALLLATSPGSVDAASRLRPGPEVAPGVFLAKAPKATGSVRAARRFAGGAKQKRQPRIVGGSPTTIAEWPWQAAITANPAIYGGNAFARQFCGGSLVTPTIVITAAHCTYEIFGSRGFDAVSNFASVTGRTTLSNNSQGQEIAWSNYYVFVDGAGQPLFNGDVTDGWDAVFAELAFPSPSSNSTPIQIAGASEASSWAPGDENAWATGWGSTSPGGSGVDTLREVNIDMIADSTCASGPYAGRFDAETMVCAGEIAGGQDTCQGDSGGPLVVPLGPGGTSPFRLVGDTSWGDSCALANRPGIYGRVAQDPMCSALRNGIQQVAGVDVVGSGGCLAGTGIPAACAVPVAQVGSPCVPPGESGDTAPPDTTITKRPKNKTKKKRVTFEFTSTEAGSSFDCTVDGRTPKAPCTSPIKVKVKKGRHTFQVRATDPSGNSDPTPASDTWKRKKKKKNRK
jgi:trypsin